MDRILVVTADDLGSGPRRNAGILDAHRRGIVRSASLLARGPATDEAARLLRDAPGLGVGLHLDLSEGTPLAPGQRSLAGPGGRFHGKEEARRRADAGLLDPGEVERETLAQIDALLDRGLRLSHLDAHHHLHLYGDLAEPVARAAARRGIGWIRRPADAFAMPGHARAGLAADYARRSARSAPVFARHGLACADAFAGVALPGFPGFDALAALVRALPPGITELMVHPGFADEARGFSGPDREAEHRALVDPRLPFLLETRGVLLRSFADLAQAATRVTT